MTQEQAVKWLRAYPKMTDFTLPQIEEALDMAEKALMEQAQADGDLISRTSVLDVLKIYKVNLTVIDIIRGLPITSVAIPSAEPSYYPPCEDCHKKMDEIRKAYDKIQSAEPKTGHWIEEDMFDGDVAYRCSECNELFWIESGTPKDNEYNFCPKCGKRLVEPQERRDKE